MKSVAEGFFAAFSLYSIFPGLSTGWARDNMRYAPCFFPVVGLFVTLFSLIWQYICLRFRLSSGLFAAGATLLPLVISGGIHMAGFGATVDAMSGDASPDKRVELLSERVGIFGMIGCGCYLLLSFGLWTQIYMTPRLMVMPPVSYVLSRALNGYSLARIPCAKTSGFAWFVSNSVSGKAVPLTCGIFALSCWGFLIWMNVVWGLAATIVCLILYMGHRRFVRSEFGGNTGDLAGFLTQNIELALLLVAAIGGAA